MTKEKLLSDPPNPPISDPQFLDILNNWRESEEDLYRAQRNVKYAENSLKDAEDRKRNIERHLRIYVNLHCKGKETGICGMCGTVEYEHVDHKCPNR